MIKFGRNYRLTIDPGDGGPPIILTMPLTLRFTLQRNVMSNLNFVTIDIFNLSEKLRNRIFQDRYVFRYKTITLEIGYDTLFTVFKGYIFEASSAREGSDIVTTIQSRDGNYEVNTSQVFQTYSDGKTLADVFKFLIGQFPPSLTLGAVGDFPEKILRPVVLNGNVYDLLKQYSQNQVFIDLGKVFVLKQNETVAGQISEISLETGILETPRRDDGFLTVTTLMEPGVSMGQEVSLKSAIMPIYNGTYKVLGVLHQGIISAAIGGSCRSTFNLFTGTQTFGSFNQVG